MCLRWHTVCWDLDLILVVVGNTGILHESDPRAGILDLVYVHDAWIQQMQLQAGAGIPWPVLGANGFSDNISSLRQA